MKPIQIALSTLIAIGLGILGGGLWFLYQATVKKTGDIADVYAGWFGILLSAVGGTLLLIAMIVWLVHKANKQRQ